MLNEQDSRTLLSHLSHNATLAQEQVHNKLIQDIEYALVAQLKPRIFKDGNKWFVLYGENIMTGIYGSGDTPYLAVIDFDKAWHKN